MIESFIIVWLKGKRHSCNTLFRGGRVEVGKGGTLILPNRVCAVEQRMVCGVPSVKQDVQFLNEQFLS